MGWIDTPLLWTFQFVVRRKGGIHGQLGVPPEDCRQLLAADEGIGPPENVGSEGAAASHGDVLDVDGVGDVARVEVRK